MTQVAASAEVSNAIKTIYGDWGLDNYESLVMARPETSESQLVADFQQDPCTHHTAFFRHRGLLEGFVAYTLPELGKEDGEVAITQLGATGEETWSLAVLLQGKRVPYSIAAYNVNRPVLDSVYGPFDVTIDEMSRLVAHWVDRPLLKQCLEDTAEGVRPRPVITGRATFDRHDILEAPVPRKAANMLVINNVLYYYPEEARGHIMANALARLRPGGAFLFEGWTKDSRRTAGYADWVRNLDQYGLLPYHERSVNSVLRYQPEKAEKIFEPSSKISDALGVLATAKRQITQAPTGS